MGFYHFGEPGPWSEAFTKDHTVLDELEKRKRISESKNRTFTYRDMELTVQEARELKMRLGKWLGEY